VPRPRLDKAQTGMSALYRLYETQEGWIQIAAVEDAHWIGLCDALGLSALVDDPRFATREARAEHRQQLEALIIPRFATRTAIQWTRALDTAGVPNEIAFDSRAGERVFFDADNERLGLVAEYDHPLLGRMRQFGSFIDFSETPGLVHGPPPLVGQHTIEILQWLGYSRSDMDELKAERVVYWPDDDYGWNV
jgi:crotonobetainyl-CoA:carnitine CoA-transferase CaiB-like acyl-CoA transferase